MMGLQYFDLTERTRSLMLEEIERDLLDKNIYISRYLNEEGARDWPAFLKDAARTGSDDGLAENLKLHGCFRTHAERRKPRGGFTMAKVPVTAAETLAESQFNMYYMRSLARQAIELDKGLLVYRAKEVEKPRSESELMINTTLNPHEVLDALRETHGVEPSINIPMPNTGITVRLI